LAGNGYQFDDVKGQVISDQENHEVKTERKIWIAESFPLQPTPARTVAAVVKTFGLIVVVTAPVDVIVAADAEIGAVPLNLRRYTPNNSQAL
jgi:hypothetical protein